jgi:hypothetical protein
VIERFNFYDLYGYFLPGIFWLVLMGLPFLLTSGVPPSLIPELTVGGLVLGYLVGHLLQNLAREFLSSKLDGRYPSDLLLDEQDKSLSASLKLQVEHHIYKRFGIDIGDSVDPGNRERRRQDAFNLCRTALAQGKAGSYAEQYQGMYSLLRGLATSCVLASSFYTGWILALGFPLSESSRRDFLGGLILAILAVLGIWLRPVEIPRPQESKPTAARTHRLQRVWHALWKHVPRLEFWLFGAMLIVLGFLAGGCYHVAAPQAFRLVVAILLLLVACRRFKNASKFFMTTFAESVYRDFLVLSTAPDGKKSQTAE